MGILSKKRQPLLNETNGITEEYQKNSLEIVKKIQEVKEKERKMKIQFKDYQIEIDELNAELKDLSNQQLFETDTTKVKELESKRKDIRLSIDDKEQLINTDSKPFLLKELNGLDGLFKDASSEYQEFRKLAASEIEEINKQIDVLETKRRFLSSYSNRDHAYFRASNLFSTLKKEYGSSVQG